jgi:hypothetical protein
MTQILDIPAHVTQAIDAARTKVAEAQDQLQKAQGAEREINALLRTRERAEQLLAHPRQNWESEPPILDGSYYVLLTTAHSPQHGPVAICQIRAHNDPKMDQYQFQCPIEHPAAVQQAWIDTLERAICTIDMLLEQQAREIL